MRESSSKAGPGARAAGFRLARPARLVFPLALLLLGALAACEEPPAENYLENAQEFYEQGDLRAAIVELKNAVQQDPNNGVARSLLGKINLDIGAAPAAEKEFRRAMNLGVDRAELLEPYGRALLLQAKYEQILEEFTVNGSGSDGPTSTILVYRGEAHRGLGRLPEAEVIFDTALEQDAQNLKAILGLARVAINRDQNDRARELLARAHELYPDELEYRSLQAEFAFQQGDYATAEAGYQAVHEALIENPFPRLGLAAAQIELGKFDQAIEHLEVYFKFLPDDPRANFLRALAAYRTGEFETAKEYSEKVLILVGSHPGSRLVAGSSAFALGQFEQARKHLQIFVAAVPSHATGRRLLGATLLNLGRAEDALEAWVPIADEDEKDAQFLAAIGAVAMETGNLEVGRHYYQQIASLEPQDAESHAQLGRILMAKGQFDESIEELEKAIELDPELELDKALDKARFARIGQLIQDKEFQAALDAARELAEKYPDNTSVLTITGAAHVGLGQTAKARAAFTRALEIDPGKRDAAMNLANMALRDKDIAAARRHMKAFLEHKPDEVGALVLLARIETALSNSSAAIESLERATAVDPTAIVPRTVLARVYLYSGRPERALELAEPLLPLHENDTGLLHVVGQSQLMTGQTVRAITNLGTLARLQPKSQVAQFLYAGALLASGDRLRGKQQLEVVLDLNPDHDLAKIRMAEVLAKDGKTEEAGRRFRELKQDAANSPALWRQIADAEFRAKRFKDAARSFIFLSGMQPDSPEPRFMLARTLAVQGDSHGAITELDRALAIDPTHGRARLVLARLLIITKQKDRATAELDKLNEAATDVPDVAELNGMYDLLMDRNPTAAVTGFKRAFELNPRGGRALSLAKAQWAARDWDAATTTLSDWLQEHPNEKPLISQLGKYYLALERYDLARPLFRRMLEFDPRSVPDLNHYAWSLRQLGELQLAMLEAEKAHLLDPDNPHVMDTLGVILVDRGDYARGIDLLEKAAEGLPDDTEISLNLAQALAKSGATVKSREIVEHLLAREDDFPEREEAEALLKTLGP